MSDGMRELRNIMRLDVWLIVRILAIVVICFPVWILFHSSKGISDHVFTFSLILLMMTVCVFYGGSLLEGMGNQDLLYDTLPLRRGTVMVSRFVTSLVCVIAPEAMLAAVLPVGKLVGMGVADGWWLELVAAVGILLSMSAIMVPAMVRFGAGKGVAVFAVVTAAMGLGIYFLAQLIFPIPAWMQVWWPLLLLPLSLVLYAGSLLVSIRFYERQDH